MDSEQTKYDEIDDRFWNDVKDIAENQGEIRLNSGDDYSNVFYGLLLRLKKVAAVENWTTEEYEEKLYEAKSVIIEIASAIKCYWPDAPKKMFWAAPTSLHRHMNRDYKSGTQDAISPVSNNMIHEPVGKYSGMALTAAAVEYLEVVGHSSETRTIANALLEGGYQTTAKNFYNNTYGTLSREAESDNPRVVKEGSKWGLPGWSVEQSVLLPVT